MDSIQVKIEIVINNYLPIIKKRDLKKRGIFFFTIQILQNIDEIEKFSVEISIIDLRVKII